MRLIEVVCALTVYAMFSAICASTVQPLMQTVEETQRIRQETARDRLVAEGFRMLCTSEANTATFAAWRERCLLLRGVESVTVSHVGFDADGNRIWLCVWVTAQAERCCYAVQRDQEEV